MLQHRQDAAGSNDRKPDDRERFFRKLLRDQGRDDLEHHGKQDRKCHQKLDRRVRRFRKCCGDLRQDRADPIGPELDQRHC